MVFSLRSPASHSPQARRLVGCWASSHVGLMLLVLRFPCFHIGSYSLCRYGWQRRARRLPVQHRGQTQLPILELSYSSVDRCRRRCQFLDIVLGCCGGPVQWTGDNIVLCHDQGCLQPHAAVYYEAQQIAIFCRTGAGYSNTHQHTLNKMTDISDSIVAGRLGRMAGSPGHFGLFVCFP